MKSLWFVIPVHGRIELSGICLRQMRRTCDLLNDEGINANAVVVSDRSTLDEVDVAGLGFASVERDNSYVSRRFNDGIQLATDPSYNDKPADYVIPCGSDDWVDHRLFLEPLPGPDTIQGFQWVSFVNETATQIAATYLSYDGGCGIRIIPRELVAALDYRPADEDRQRGCDTSILVNLRRHHGDALKIKHFHIHDRQVVDWKTSETQLNSYRNVQAIHRSNKQEDVFGALAEFYPAEALDEMASYYGTLVPA